MTWYYREGESFYLTNLESILTLEGQLVLAQRQLQGMGMEGWCTLIEKLAEHFE